MFWDFFIIFVCFVPFCFPAKILGVFPTPSYSHQVVYRALTVELSKRGHEVTVISTDPVKDPPSNYTQIDLHDVTYKQFTKGMKNMVKMDLSEIIPYVTKIFAELFDDIMFDPRVKRVLNEKYDLLIIESIMPIAFGFAHHFKGTPYIGITSMSMTSLNHRNIGNPIHPLLYPDQLASAEDLDQSTLFKRVKTCLRSLLTYYFVFNSMAYGFDTEIKKHFGEDAPHYFELENQMELLIVGSYPILSGIRPNVPAVINAGGMHILPPKPLPEEMKHYLDSSSQGVIYMSLGTNVSSKDLSKELLQIIIRAFGELPFNFLWKFELDELKGKPKNVKLSKWLPQNDVLAHPNVKAFIFQGGAQSMEEAIKSAVPLIGIPFFSDQFVNIGRVEKLEIGIGMDKNTMTKDDLKNAILEITSNPRFKNNITKLQSIILDEPMTGLEKAVWWTEYVIRHKSAKHLKAPAADASWTDILMLDVLGVLLAIFISLILLLISVIYLLYKILKKIFFSKSKINQKEKSS